MLARNTTLVAAGLLAGSLHACAGTAGPGAGVQRSYDVITLEEIEVARAETAYQLVQQLRPRWMTRSRGDRSFDVSSADLTKVVVDDMPPREFGYLGEIPKVALFELRLLSPREATFLYGTGYNNGIIKVTTKK